MRTSTTFLLLEGVASAALASVVAMSTLGCDCSGSTHPTRRDAGTGPEQDATIAHDANYGDSPYLGPVDAYIVPDPDAFFATDPPPMTCYPDGGMGPWPDPPGGTPECPDDRNREGCRCEHVGETAACWPGHRANRNRGQCHDGMTTCLARDEFGGAWGPCVGAVLPTPGATRGPQACECFSAGRWAIDNLSPCFVSSGAGGTPPIYAVSTFIDPASGNAMCPRSITSVPPPPEPGTDWSTDALTVDCAGQFHLCYTLRAGDATMPHDTDCVLAETCVDTWYPTANAMQTLPPLPAWTSSDTACALAFTTTGGYGEMSVQGLSIECNEIGDTSGSRYVFNRVRYCPTSCNTNPSAPECANCMQGGSGNF
ncbi:MAG: hypothetical protein U0234_07605 [Sandaracinus sp.]